MSLFELCVNLKDFLSMYTELQQILNRAAGLHRSKDIYFLEVLFGQK